MPSGGKRQGAGRPKSGGEVRKQCALRATRAEWLMIQRFAKIIKYGDKAAAQKFLDDNQ
ncbi:MAG: hypothetical protein II968_01165 [Selenomonadaceae bacterium]|nr:hypothetical protein [Selenomonadaceae bacterium]